jgi:hypothetical protein
MAIQLLLAENQFTVNGNLKDASFRRNDRPLRDLELKLFQNFVRQTDGSISVASLRAVFNRYVHFIHYSSLSGRSDHNHFIASRIKRIEFVRSINFLEIETALLQQQLHLIPINESKRCAKYSPLDLPGSIRLIDEVGDVLALIGPIGGSR